MVDFAPGMRTIIRDEEWMIKKIETNSLGKVSCFGFNERQNGDNMNFCEVCIWVLLY